ncbi:MAG: hypothetical protein ACQSGP_02045 [Frankia sp.]
MHCLISVIMNRWPEYDTATRVLKQKILQHPDPLSFDPPPVFHEASGFLLVVDWDGDQVLAGKKFPKPFGFALRDETLYVATWGGEDILAVRGNTVIGRFQHPWFNHLHSLDATPDGLLITSSGTDLIAEIDYKGRMLWDCFLFEHGYDRDPYPLAGLFDRTQNYNHRYIPSYLDMHVNSAIHVDDRTVLATVFRSNELVRIDRGTKRIESVLNDLHRPHAIRRRPGGYIVSDTEGKAVVLLDSRMRKEHVIPVPAPWIQDAVLTAERLMVVSNQKMTGSPNDTSKTDPGTVTGIVELTLDGIPTKRLDLGDQHRIYMVEPITPTQAQTLASAWRENPINTAFAQWSRVAAN